MKFARRGLPFIVMLALSGAAWSDTEPNPEIPDLAVVKKPRATKSSRSAKTAKPRKPPAPTANAVALMAATDSYKKELARSIEQANPDQVYATQPQALLRSVVVLEFVIDPNGKLLSSRIRRSNRDKETEALALASLRAAAPFPKPPAGLLRRGRLELNETWLFNNDGRFQIRSTALVQSAQ
jgi:protein TonB